MSEDLRAAAAGAISASTALEDPDYPLIHLAPSVGRLNDPNGLLIDGGVAHAFYQFTPQHPDRKLVYWGHASSRDYEHWYQHEPAIIPDSTYDAHGAYSGNAVILDDDEVASAPDRARYQLFFTGNLKDAQGHRTPSQCLATSHDLRDIAKWPANPLIATQAPGYTPHFRDPSVSRDPEGGWRMILGVQRENLTGAALIYHSEDLLTWSRRGELSIELAPGCQADADLSAFGYMWECPGVVSLVDEATGRRRDVFFFCPQGASVVGQEGFENIFPCVYIVGDLNGTCLQGWDGTIHEMDRGFEFYAPQVFAQAPGCQTGSYLLGWAGNASQDDQPSIASGGWVHTMTCVRELSLRNGRLVARPATRIGDADTHFSASLDYRREHTWRVAELEGHRSWRLALDLDAAASDINGGGGSLGEGSTQLRLRIGGRHHWVEIAVDMGKQPALLVDRSHSRYAQHGAVRRVSLENRPRRIELIHDRSITEVFLDDGELVFTLRSFVDQDCGGVAVHAGALVHLGTIEGAVYDS